LGSTTQWIWSVPAKWCSAFLAYESTRVPVTQRDGVRAILSWAPRMTPIQDRPADSPIEYAQPVAASSVPAALGEPRLPLDRNDAGEESTSGIEFTPGKVLRALRRRWWIAILLGLIGAAIAGYEAEQLIGLSYTVRTQVYVPPDRAGVPGFDTKGDSNSFQRRQAAFVHSRQVLQAAVLRPGVSELPSVRDNSDPFGWLEKNLTVDFGASPDIMRINIKGSQPGELIILLNGIREAYLEEGINREFTEKTATLKWLQQLMTEEHAKLDAARGDVTFAAEKLSAPDAASVRLRYQNCLTQLANLRTLRFQQDVQRKTLLLTRDELIASPPDRTAVESVPINPADLRAAIELRRRGDSESTALKSAIDRLEREIAEYKLRIADGVVNMTLEGKKRDLREAMAALSGREKTIEKEATQQLEAEGRRGGDFRVQEHQRRVSDLKVQADGLKSQIGALDAEVLRMNGEALSDAKGIVELDRLANRVSDVEQRIKATKARAEILETDLGVGNPHKAQTHEEAVVTLVPNPMKKQLMVVGAVAAGFAVMVLGVAFLDLRAKRIDSPEGVDRRLHTGVVGCIPRVSPTALAALTRPMSGSPGPDQAAVCDATDACRSLMLNALSGGQSKVIMVSSAGAGEGKTTLASQLALSLARAGYRTLLIDGDVRRPAIHRMFGRSQSPGLTDVLRKTHPLQHIIRKSPLPNLLVMPAGQCNPHEAVSLLQLRLGSLLRKCKPYFDVILIDTPPLMNLPDAMVIGRHADGTVLSLMNEVSTLPAAQAACARLRTLNIPLLGAVLNGARIRTSVAY
jgi:polysaccharide biosynthesis transport protein